MHHCGWKATELGKHGSFGEDVIKMDLEEAKV
jgi:hypothetical protein